MAVAEPLERLTEALDSLSTVDVDALTGAQLDEQLVALLRLSHRLDAATYRLAARWETDLVWMDDGSKSADGRLSRAANTSTATARRVLCRARQLRAMPATEAALAAGEVSAEHVDLLAGANARQRGELFARDEKLLVDHAKELRYAQLGKVVAYWKHRADAEVGDDGDEPEADTPQARVGQGVSGEVHLEADLDPVGGAEVQEALRRITEEIAASDRTNGGRTTRSKLQLRADAIVEMARRAMAMPAGARKPRPLVTIVCGDQAFAELCELANGAVITPGMLVPHLGDVDIETIIFDSPLHAIGKSNQRSFTGALRRAIEVRDRHCQHPSGCDEPINRCDADHIVPRCWGGETSQANGRLLCAYHNRIEPQLTTPPDQPLPDDPPDNGPGHHDPTRQQRPPPHHE